MKEYFELYATKGRKFRKVYADESKVRSLISIGEHVRENNPDIQRGDFTIETDLIDEDGNIQNIEFSDITIEIARVDLPKGSEN